MHWSTKMMDLVFVWMKDSTFILVNWFFLCHLTHSCQQLTMYCSIKREAFKCWTQVDPSIVSFHLFVDGGFHVPFNLQSSTIRSIYCSNIWKGFKCWTHWPTKILDLVFIWMRDFIFFFACGFFLMPFDP
jgi:hypothetical protein